MNKLLSIVKDTAKSFFAGKTVGRAIDVAERGVQIAETAATAILWVKITAALLVIGILIAFVAVVVAIL